MRVWLQLLLEIQKKSEKEKGSSKHGAANSGGKSGSNNIDKWKSMDNLDGQNNNFTLRWRYPQPNIQPQISPISKVSVPSSSPKSGKNKNAAGKAHKQVTTGNIHPTGNFEICSDYRQNRFTKNGKQSRESSNNTSSGHGNSTLNIFSRYSKKVFSQQPQPQATATASNLGNHNHNLSSGDISSKDKENNLKMFSLPPFLVSQGLDLTNHRICDLPSGLY